MREITYVEALREAIREEMERDETVFLLGEIVQHHYLGVTTGLPKEKSHDMPISEAGFTGMAFGAAMTGMRPIVEMYHWDFSPVAFDQIVNHIAKEVYISGTKIPLVIRGFGGGGYSGGPHHAQSLYAWYANVPGLKVVLPSTPYDVKGLLKTAIRDDNPVIIVDHIKLYYKKGPVPEDEYLIPFGVADIKREGKDVTIFATLLMVHRAMKAADRLAKEGISVEVIDPRTLTPLDKKTIIESVKKTGRLVVVDEGPRSYGVSAEIAAIVAEDGQDYLKTPIKRVANPDTPVPFSPPLEKFVMPDEDQIEKAVRETVDE